MLESRRPTRGYRRYTWLCGFFGLLGFSYFFSGRPQDLFYFSFLAFFSSYFTTKLADELLDERYEEDRQKAQATTMVVPTVALIAIGLGLVVFDASLEIIVLLAALGWAATFIAYAAAFWYYEKH